DYKDTRALDDWAGFPGGELEGKRPRRLCPACRAAMQATADGRERRGKPAPLCFQCYRAEMDHQRALATAGNLNTASEARFQTALPFEPVNRPRLEMLKAEHAAALADHRDSYGGSGSFDERRRRAQLAARHALQRIAAGMGDRRSVGGPGGLGSKSAAHARV